MTLGGKHIAISVSNIEKAYRYIRAQSGFKMINMSDDYRPFRIDAVSPDEVEIFDLAESRYQKEVKRICEAVSRISYFYFVDKYDVQWEFEQGDHLMES